MPVIMVNRTAVKFRLTWVRVTDLNTANGKVFGHMVF